MIFGDTGYFIAHLNPRDGLHLRSVAWSARLLEPLLTTEFILVEVADALSSPLNRSLLHDFLKVLRKPGSCEIIPVTSSLFEQGLHLHAARPYKEWSLTDCISFVVMRERKVTRALAYDHHFEQAGFDPLLRRDPD